MPRVSVIIPTYNRRAYVQEAIDSVLAQTYRDYEIIVVDDGSTDGTGEALATRYGDRIRYVWQENQGESVARNRGIEMARGEYIAFLDSDDLWLPEKLAKQVAYLDANHDTAMVCCEAWTIDSASNRLDSAPLQSNITNADLSMDRLCLDNAVTAGGSTALVRKSTLDQVGGFDQTIRFGEDWDLWLRISQQWNIEIVKKPLAEIRIHRNAQCHIPSPDKADRVLQDHLRLLGKAFASWPGTQETLARTRSLSIGRQYAMAAFAFYAGSRFVDGRRHLELAVGLDPQTWKNEELLSRMLVNHGIAIVETEGDVTPVRLSEYVKGTLDHWPSGLHLPRRIRSRVLGRLLAEVAYRHFLTDNGRKHRNFVWRAILVDPVLVTNLGMLKRLFSHAT